MAIKRCHLQPKNVNANKNCLFGTLFYIIMIIIKTFRVFYENSIVFSILGTPPSKQFICRENRL